MSGIDYKVPPISWRDIGHFTDKLRKQLGLDDVPKFPIMEVLEQVLYQRLGVFTLEVATKSEMKDAEGYTCQKGEFIMLREDVYEAAWAGDGRARFTASHEFGHMTMHTNIPLSRATKDENVRPFRRSEPQANQFAAELLMPRNWFDKTDTVRTVIERHGVSYKAASNRLDYLSKEGII